MFLLAWLSVSRVEIIFAPSLLKNQWCIGNFSKKQCHKGPLIQHVQAFNCCMLCVHLQSACEWRWQEKSVFLYLAASTPSCLCWYYRFGLNFQFPSTGIYKSTTQECSGQWIIVNQINMVLISLAGPPLHGFHRGAACNMTRANSEMDCVQVPTPSCSGQQKCFSAWLKYQWLSCFFSRDRKD